MWGGALLARIEASEQRTGLAILASEQRLSAELARHVRALEESLATRIAVP